MKYRLKFLIFIILCGAAATVGIKAADWFIPSPPMVVLLCTPEEVETLESCKK
jgi:hypothetical protein